MSLIETLKEKGADLVEERGGEYYDKAIAEGRKAVAADLADEKNPLKADGAEAANKALDILAANKTHFVNLGSVTFAWVVAHWEDGDEAEARRHYLECEATFEERRAAMHAAGDAVAQARKQREEAWESVSYVLRKVGEVGLRYALKALPVVLGIA